jgi:hypothetical protein
MEKFGSGMFIPDPHHCYEGLSSYRRSVQPPEEETALRNMISFLKTFYGNKFLHSWT